MAHRRAFVPLVHTQTNCCHKLPRHLPRLWLCQLINDTLLKQGHVGKALVCCFNQPWVNAAAAADRTALELIHHEGLKGKVSRGYVPQCSDALQVHLWAEPGHKMGAIGVKGG